MEIKLTLYDNKVGVEAEIGPQEDTEKAVNRFAQILKILRDWGWVRA